MEGLNHYTMVCGINSNQLKDKVLGHPSAYWNTMNICFSDIHTFYCQTDFKAPEVSVISEVKSTKEPRPCFTFSGPHFQRRCMKNKGHSNNSRKFHQNNYNSGKFLYRYYIISSITTN